MNLNRYEEYLLNKDAAVSIPIRDLMNLNLYQEYGSTSELNSFNPY